MERTRLVEILLQLGPDVFAAVSEAAPEPAALPGPEAGRLKIALSLSAQVQAKPEALGSVLAVMDRFQVPFRQDPVTLWQARQLQDARHVPIIGFHDKGRHALSIDAIFVPLGFDSPEIGLRRGWTEGSDSAAEAPTGDLTIEQVIRKLDDARPGLSIVGLPGSGKTTLVKHLYRRVRDEGSDAVGLPAGLTPVWFRAARVIEGLSAGDRQKQALATRGLATVVELEAAAAGPDYGGAGRALAEAGPLLVLVDGLDEVGGELAVRDVCAWLNNRIQADPRHRWVVTCRYAAWEATGGPLRGVLSTVHVRDLTLDAATTYVRRWFEAVAARDRMTPAEFEAKRERLATTITDPKRLVSGRLRAMVGNPLMLSLVCLVHHTLGDLPQARAKLYDECLGVLLVAFAERKSEDERSFRQRVQVDVDAARHALEPLAWAMQCEQDGDRPVDLPEARILEGFREVIPRVPGLRNMSPEAFLQLVSADCGVLHSADLKSYRFVHLSLQEHLAALHAESRTDEGARELAAHLGEARWMEPILLAMSRGTLFTPFFRAALARPDAAALETALRECLAEASAFKPEAFAEVLEKGAPPPLVSAWRRVVEGLGLLAPAPPAVAPEVLRLVLGLVRGQTDGRLVQAVSGLKRHPDAGVSRDVRRFFAPVPGGRSIRCGNVEMELVWVPAGSFWMGATTTPGQNQDPEAYPPEGPVRRVELTEGFWMGRHPVTVAQYRAFCAATREPEPESFRNPKLRGAELPVTMVDWTQATAFAAWLHDGGLQAALPTEAEWEYAARGEDGRRYPWGDDAPTPDRAWWNAALGGPDGKWRHELTSEERERAPDAPAAIGGRPAGASWVGAEDMAGNVWEWCRDAWADTQCASTVDPCHPGDNNVSQAPRVVRGGAWDDPSWYLRCSHRKNFLPWFQYDYHGFRVVFRPQRG